MVMSISPAEAERAEADSYCDFEDAAPREAKAALGTRRLRIGGGVALAVPGDPTGFWSKSLGFGFSEPVTLGLLERVTGFYREQGMPSARLQFAPQILPPDWAAIREKLDISDSGSACAKLIGDLGTVAEVAAGHGGAASYLDTGLRAGIVPVERARDWASVMWEVFGFPVEHQIEMPIGVVGRPGWQAFGVFEDEEIVAAGALHTWGRVGHLFGDATLARARGRGAQPALIAARAMAAREAGCDWLVAEAVAERPGEHNSSLRNMLSAGMNVIYERQNWIWSHHCR